MLIYFGFAPANECVSVFPFSLKFKLIINNFPFVPNGIDERDEQG